jgi:hypothetical protein
VAPQERLGYGEVAPGIVGLLVCSPHCASPSGLRPMVWCGLLRTVSAKPGEQGEPSEHSLNLLRRAQSRLGKRSVCQGSA